MKTKLIWFEIGQACDKVFEEFDAIQRRHKLTDAEIVNAVDVAAGTDLADSYFNWIEEGKL